MQIIEPDFERLIDLPGVGPCPRPVDIDQSVTGFSDLVSLRIYSFAEGHVIDGEAEEDEVFVVLMCGAANVTVHAEGKQAGVFDLSVDGGPRAVYLPPHAEYQLTARADADVAYARVRPAGAAGAVSSFDFRGGSMTVSGHATAMDFTLATSTGNDRKGSQQSLDALPERFFHVRAADGGSVTIAGRVIGDWQTAAVERDEQAEIIVGTGTAEILTVTATGR